MSEDKRTYKVEEDEESFHNNHYTSGNKKKGKDSKNRQQASGGSLKTLAVQAVTIGVLILVFMVFMPLAGKLFMGNLDKSVEIVTKEYKERVLSQVDWDNPVEYTVESKTFNKRTGRFARGTAYNVTLIDNEGIEYYVEVPEGIYPKLKEGETVNLFEGAEEHSVLIYGDTDLLSILGSSAAEKE